VVTTGSTTGNAATGLYGAGSVRGMKHRIAAVSVTALLTLAGCGSDSVSSDEARRIVVSGLIDAGQSPDVAACVANTALERHSPGDLVNTSGTTSAAVNASIGVIVAACTAELTPPTSPPPTVPSTTVPATTTPATTIPPLDPTACAAGQAVLVALDAAALIDDPGPAAFEAWLDEARARAELAVLATAEAELRELHRSIQAAIGELDQLAAANGYDASAPDVADRANAIGTELDTLAADVTRANAEHGCDADPNGAADAAVLAAQLIALDDVPPPTTIPTTVPAADIEVRHAGSGIVVSVPAGWTGERGGVAATPFAPSTRFLIRAADPAVFDGGRFDGTGVAIYAVDGTVDVGAVLAASEPARYCTLAGERAYDDGVYVGVRREYTDCGGTPVSIVVVGAADNAARVTTYVEVRAASLTDRAVDVVLNSFYV